MFNKKSQKTTIAVLAMILSLALIGSSFVGLGGLFSNTANTTDTEYTQQEYDQLIADIELYTAALAEDANKIELYKTIADCYRIKASSGLSPEEESDWQKALENYQAYAVTQENPSSEVLYGVAFTAQMTKQYEIAKVTYLQLLKLEPENINWIYNYGLVEMYGFDNKTEAIAQWEKAKTLTTNQNEIAFLDVLIQQAQLETEKEDTQEETQTE